MYRRSTAGLSGANVHVHRSVGTPSFHDSTWSHTRLSLCCCSEMFHNYQTSVKQSKFHFLQSECAGEHFTHEKLLTSCPFPLHPSVSSSLWAIPIGSTPHTALINSQQAHLPSFPLEEVISSNVSVARALRGPCGGRWLAIDRYSHFRSKKAPYTAPLLQHNPAPSQTLTLWVPQPWAHIRGQ